MDEFISVQHKREFDMVINKLKNEPLDKLLALNSCLGIVLIEKFKENESRKH
jgi:hypothetical protein